MINFTAIPQTITAALGAVLLSATFLSASFGPVHADQLHNQPSASAQVSA
jgi:hypothetical protein